MSLKVTLQRLREVSPRDLLAVGLPSLALLIGGFWLAAQFIKPALPDHLVLSSGGSGGSYQVYAERYRQVLARNGIELRERPSAGSIENLKRLLDEDDETEVGLVQSGTANGINTDKLLSLGSLYYEPLWVFYRGEAELDRLTQLKGKRIAIGAEGSGTRKLSLDLLEANGLDAKSTVLLPLGGLQAVEALQQRKADVVFVVGADQSAAVWSLLYADGIRLMSMSHAEAYARRFPQLARLVLPQGAIDMARNIPSRDVSLVSPVAMLVVHESTHPALIQLLMQVVTEVHGEAGVFQRPGEFPKASQIDFPLAPEAERFYKSGKPFLQRYLPFWAANLMDRMFVLLLPVLTLLIPILRFAPGIYAWRIRSRIYRRYGELKFLEAEVEADPGRHNRAEWLAHLDRIEEGVQHVATPLAFTDMLYTLRVHVGLVRATILRRTPPDAAQEKA